MNGDGLIPYRTPPAPKQRQRERATIAVAALALLAVVLVFTIGIPITVAAGAALMGRPSQSAGSAVDTTAPTLAPTNEPVSSVPTPDVVGMTRSAARLVLQNRGFAAVDQNLPASEDDRVVAQQPEASAQAPEGTVVSLRFAASTLTPTPTPTPTPTAAAPVPAPPPVDTVQYSVWGNGSSASSVTYSIPNGAFSQSQVADAGIPWSVTLPITGSYNSFVMVVQAGDGNSISCAISINGRIVDQETSTGQYTVVTCSH